MIIFATTFTGKTPHGDGFKGQDWYGYRAKIYEDYTLKSLMDQTDKNFLIWLQFRPEEKDNPTTRKIDSALRASGLKYILTFNGPIMMEDKALWHNIDLLERAEKSLKEILVNDDWVYEVNIDSDDMVCKTFVEVLKSKEPKDRGAFYMKGGYILTTDNRLAKWNNPVSMSLYVIVYPRDVFLDAKEHFKYQNGFSSHEQIPEKFNAELLPDGMYCCLDNGTNISTTWEHPFRGEEYLYDDDKIKIINNFIC